MAQYDVRHVCGHTVVHRLFGPTTGRTARINRLRQVPCWPCLREIEREAAEAWAEREGLPPLVGSDAQIAWASVLRHKAILVVDRTIASAGLGPDHPVLIPAALAFFPGEQATVGAALAILRAQDGADWWISRARDVASVGKPFDLARGTGGVTEDRFADELLRAAVGVGRPGAEELMASADPADWLRAIVRGN